MTSPQVGTAIRITAIVAIAVNALLNALPSDALGGHGPRVFSLIVLVATAVWLLWDVILWRVFLKLLPNRRAEVVHGTWQGRLETSWTDPETGIAPSPKRAYLVVYQTFSQLRVRLITDESQSFLLTGHLHRGDERLELIYVYETRPQSRVRRKNPRHYGAASLMITPDIKVSISGHYWTDRESLGELEFTEHVGKRAGGFREAAAMFVDSESK